jgi:hypothetical protein
MNLKPSGSNVKAEIKSNTENKPEVCGKKHAP